MTAAVKSDTSEAMMDHHALCQDHNNKEYDSSDRAFASIGALTARA